jgi:lipopolysaccharide export system protein LptC
MNSRLYDRLAALISLLLLASLGLFTYYLAAVADRAQPAPQPRATGEPDYFVEGLALIKMDERGAPSFRLEAQRLTHYPDDDSAEFVRPRLVSLDPSRPRILIVADIGRVADDGNETHLTGNVVITRSASDGAPELRAETDYAVVLPEQDLVRTDRPVRIVQGGNTLTGVGMVLDNRTRRLQVDSQVRAVWQAGAVEPAPPARQTRPSTTRAP